MNIEGAAFLVGMFGPPVAGYFLLRRAGRKTAGALGGAVMLWAICTAIAVAIAGFADSHGIPLDTALWAYLPIIGLITFGFARKAL